MSTDTSKQQNVTGVSTDRKHELLSNSRRRKVLTLLAEHGRMGKGELADKIAPTETDGRVSGQDRKRVVVALHQCHLPKMVDYGVLEQRPDGYQLKPAADDLLPHIKEIPRRKRASSVLSRAMGRY